MSEARNEAIRNGLLQYIGALLAETSREGAEAAHVALAKLSEVWLEASRTKDGKHYDTYKAKPVLRAAALILNDYVNQLQEQFKDGNIPQVVSKKAAEYRMAAASINEIVEATKESLDDN